MDPQDVITLDNVSVKVNAVIYFRVIDPIKAIVEMENYSYAISQLAQTTLRSVCGGAELDDDTTLPRFFPCLWICSGRLLKWW